MEDEHLADVVVAFGYAEAAQLCGMNIAALHKRMKAQGWLDEIQLRRGRRPQGQRQGRVAGQLSHYVQACQTLGVSRATLRTYLDNGRLSSPLDLKEVQALRDRWAIVPREEFAAELAKWDKCWRQCQACGEFFKIKLSWVKQGRGAACSGKCRGILRSRRFGCTIKVIKVPSRRVAPPRKFHAGYCEDCSSAFVYPQIETCCPDCRARRSRKASRDRRKARERGAVKIERVFRSKVYERDKWRCHICDGKIDPALEAPDPGAATLDHIHPLSLGGSHTYDNIKAAHYGCNSSRGNRDQFQMRMPVAA